MNPRTFLRPVILASALIVSASSCATFTEADTVIAVRDGDTRITIEQGSFDALLGEFVGRPDVFGTTPAVDGIADAEQARYLASALIRSSAVNAVLATNDTAISDSDRDVVLSALESDHPWRTLSADFLALVVDSQSDVVRSALTRVAPASADDLERLYAAHPAATGVMCTRHILVDARAEALAVIDRLSNGGEFAIVAAEVSTEPAAVDTGGALGTADSACIPVSQYNSGFDPAFTRGAYATATTAVSVPVESSFGWHVIVHRPWDDVGDDVIAAHVGIDSAILRVEGLLATSSVDIDPRYGTWDPVDSAVIPVG